MLEYFSLLIGIIGPNSPAASNNGQTLAAGGPRGDGPGGRGVGPGYEGGVGYI